MHIVYNIAAFYVMAIYIQDIVCIIPKKGLHRASSASIKNWFYLADRYRNSSSSLLVQYAAATLRWEQRLTISQSYKLQAMAVYWNKQHLFRISMARNMQPAAQILLYSLWLQTIKLMHFTSMVKITAAYIIKAFYIAHIS